MVALFDSKGVVAAGWCPLRMPSRFTWGRSRLPMSADQFHQTFKIHAFTKAPADAYLPVAHTCFFSLELPRYSTRQVCEGPFRRTQRC